jgi:hypothetical protein
VNTRKTTHFATLSACGLLASLSILSCGGKEEEGQVDTMAAARSGAMTAGGQSLALARVRPIIHAAIPEDRTRGALDGRGTAKIEPSMDAAANAQNICTELKAETTAKACKAATINCPMASTTVTVTFTGQCEIHGVTVSGQVTIGVTGGKGTPVGVTFEFTNLVVNQYTIQSGALKVTTSDAITYTSETLSGKPLVTGDGTKVEFKGTMKADTNSIGFTMDGTGTVQAPNEKYPVTYTARMVHQAYGACYPDSGGVTQTTMSDVPLPRGGSKTVSVNKNIVFDPCTPKTGNAMVTVTTVDKTTPPAPVPLPSYGSCPPQKSC